MKTLTCGPRTAYVCLSLAITGRMSMLSQKTTKAAICYGLDLKRPPPSPDVWKVIGSWVGYSAVESLMDEFMAGCANRGQDLAGGGHWGHDPKGYLLIPGSFLLPGCHKVSTFPLPGPSTMLFPPWSWPTMG